MTAASSHPPSLAGTEWLVRQETQAVFAALAAAGHEARAVGGIVRNALLGLGVTDIDIATPAMPEAVMAAGRAAGLKVFETGIDHGTVTLVANHVPHEVTTLRRDVSTDGRRATVAFTTDWAEDARRRDFTMNALYCDAQGTVHDPLGGYPDVIARRVRFIGDADTRIAEDYLRILRFFRFHAVLGDGALDREGMAACIRGREGLGQLSAERVRAELLRLLCGRKACEAVAAMIDCGLLARILGRAPRPSVLGGAIAAEASVNIDPDPVFRLSALSIAVQDDVSVLARTLKLSNEESAALLVIDLQLLQDRLSLDEHAGRQHIYREGIPGWRRAILGAIALAPDNMELRRLYSLPDRWAVPKLPVKGADVLALGILPGPRVGAILSEVERWWVAADFPPEATVRAKLAVVVAD